jgi:hypothetical protein
VKASDLAVDSRLLNGVLSSVNLFRLVAFLKQELRWSSMDDEPIPQNLGSLSRIARILEAKRAG